jgi:hypothetical protein
MIMTEIEQKIEDKTEQLKKMAGLIMSDNECYLFVLECFNEAVKQVKSTLAPVSNCAELKPPHFKQKKMTEKADRAKCLVDKGYSIRETMRIMGYKSPKSIQDLLKK